MTTNAGRVDIAGFSLATLVPLAFRVPQSQVKGPDWMGAQSFDIHATMPAGGSEAQIPDMLQALLRDRFKLTTHRESRERTAYALLTSKGELKLAQAAENPENPDPAGPGAVLPLGGGSVRITDDAGGRGGTLTGPRTGPVRMARGADGSVRIEAPRILLAGLADLLTQLLRQPVIDATGLEGRYQAILEIPGARGPSPQPQPGAPTASDPVENPIFLAVRRLGLMLESRKIPVEVIVIDHLEKTPTEN